jgi:CheY-like chemotaxis protein
MKKINTVCIVDDDDIYQFTVKHEIERTHLVDQVKSFSDGEQAIHFLKQAAHIPALLPDILFLDINMPIMDGWDFLDEFAQLNHDLDKKITIYMVSSSNNQKDVERAKRFDEVTDYLIKPVTRDKLTLLFNEFGA